MGAGECEGGVEQERRWGGAGMEVGWGREGGGVGKEVGWRE